MSDSQLQSESAPVLTNNRRRRRALLVAIAVVFITAFYLAPRHDPRFVGRWSTRSPSGAVGYYELRADGTGTVLTSKSRVFPLRWWNSRGQLILHYGSESALHTAHALFEEFKCKVRGIGSDGSVQNQPVSIISEDRITFKDWVWERAPNED
jgi:hypothetical protein